MADYIKREDVIDRLEKTFLLQAQTARAIVEAIPAADAIEGLQKCVDDLEADNDNLCERIKDLSKWIPVTERLPEENGKYLTVFTINTIPPRPVMEVCCYAKDLYKVDKYDFQDKKRKSGFYQYDSEWGFFEMSDISHWMPLPEPPKDGEE